MKKISTSTISNLPIIALAIIFSLSAFLMTSCGGGDSSGSTAKVDSTKAKFKILGTWLSADNPADMAVFTADSVSQLSGGHAPEAFKYNWINEQEIEILNSNTGKQEQVKVTIAGDSLTLTVQGKEVKLIREGAMTVNNNITPANTDNSTTPATTDTSTTVQPTMTEEVKAFKNTLAGNWSDDKEKVVFTNEEITFYDKSNGTKVLVWKYIALDEKTVDLTDAHGIKSKATMTFEDNNNTLKWNDSYGNFTYKREANTP
jgi:hypothetical protein